MNDRRIENPINMHEAAKINWNKTVDITKASFLAMWKLANEKKY